MNAPQKVEQLAKRMTSGKEFTAWADEPPPRGAAGTLWEKHIIELAEAGDPRFIEKLRKHVASGVIRSERALAVLNTTEPDAAA
jgi:hypothetical protein